MLSCSIWFTAPSFWMGGGLESRCVRCWWCRARHHQHRTHDLRSGFQDHHPSKNSVQKTICCNSTSNALCDGRMYPKHLELRIHQKNCIVASSWYFTLFQGTVDCIFCLIMNRYFLFSFFSLSLPSYYFSFLLRNFRDDLRIKTLFFLTFFYDLQLRDKSKRSSQLDATSSSSSRLCLFLSYVFTMCHKNERSGVCYCQSLDRRNCCIYFPVTEWRHHIRG